MRRKKRPRARTAADGAHAQRAAGLSDAEGAILKQIAFDCNLAVSGLDAQMDALDANFHAQQESGQHAVYPSAQRKALAEQKIQIINAHIDQLQALLGPDSFQKLDTYLTRTLKVEIKGPAAGAIALGSAK